MADAVTGYHTAHLPEDPARAVVWKVVAEHLSAWVRAHGARTSAPFEGIEITRQLPPAWQTR